MFIRSHRRFKDGKSHAYWSLCETIRTSQGPRQRILCYLGELNSSDENRWRKSISVFNSEGQEKQLELFPSDHPGTQDDPDVVRIRMDRVAWERPRECGNVILGLELWKRLELDRFWQRAVDQTPGDVRWSSVAAILAINRLLEPGSELSIEERWYPKTALDDLLGIPEEKINTDRLYRALDLMIPHKEALESHLKRKYGELFGADYELLLYDLTSTYFEGQCFSNTKARRGYSRDHRFDCKQVLIALVVSSEGFPLAYEVFDGNRRDVTTLEDILRAVETKYGAFKRIWVFDRGVTSEDNLEILRQHGGQYLVGTPRSKLKLFEKELLDGDWKRVREEVDVKLVSVPDTRETYVLCRGEGNQQKERAIYERFTGRIEHHLKKLGDLIADGKIKDTAKIHQRIGAILARHPKAAGLYEVTLISGGLVWKKTPSKDAWARLRQGHYLLRTNVTGQSPEELWEKYIQLTEAEAAFRALKSELCVRPIWHQKQSRVEAHILVAFLGYCLWVALKHTLRRSGLGLSPMKTLHRMARLQSGDILLETTDNRKLMLRRISRPDRDSQEILRALGISLPVRLTRDLEMNVVQT